MCLQVELVAQKHLIKRSTVDRIDRPAPRLGDLRPLSRP
ncbi:Uncharacterised protein [Mycobacteroides abscessus subsp. abscessus]|nr:Uncharacterised protein [Mycobacteroides abscessus subsp. abscessus]